MATHKVYVTDHVFKNLDPERAILKDMDCELIELSIKDSSELKEAAADAEVLLNTYLPNLSAEVMDSLPNLKGIVRYGIGVDTIDLQAAKERGIQVANVPDYCIDEVSDHAVALALTLVRKTALSSNRIKAGDYGLNYVHPIRGLRSSTVTVVGYGRIGKRIARKMEAFGCKLQFCDPFVESDELAAKVTLDEACENSDIIILQSPSVPETHHMLNVETFSKMQKKPYIVNTARGDLIDTAALEQALITGQISGAGLDVVEGYASLDADFSLCKYENVILTPHSAWVSEDALVALQSLAAQEVRRILKGEKLRSSVIR